MGSAFSFNGLTGSDVFLRNPVTSSKLKLAQAVPPPKIEHEKDFGRITPELVKRGGDLFKVHCMSCHTPEKSFKSDTSQKVYEMIVPGVHGGSPHSFSDLGEKERWALVHYIESLRK
ncbi:MAG: cytochrome c [Deltaproteobacteria bacterium]|nr:cytochrome c [Deltaproteobacteria bacterium]